MQVMSGPQENQEPVDNQGPICFDEEADFVASPNNPTEPAHTHPAGSSNSPRSISSAHVAGVLQPPEFGQYQMTIGCLILTTLLAVGSALDARNQCISQEMYSWLTFSTNQADSTTANSHLSEFSTQSGRRECMKLFRNAIVPAGVSTILFGVLGLFLIQRHLRYLRTTVEGYVPSHLPVLIKLLVSLSVVLSSWTYGIFAIMLKPKVDPGGYEQNPFKSLAAVDQFGHIGDNANLYYLSWVSEILISTLVYQIAGECVRRFRRGSHHQPVQQTQSNISDMMSIHQRIQSMLSNTSARGFVSLYKKRRRKWYQFMLHLRQRSGYWVAAFLSSLALLASSTYVFIQVLVSLASEIYGEGVKYREVCGLIQGTDDLPEEFCTRTYFSVVAGAFASVLCILAIILHAVVRRRAARDEDKARSCSVMDTQVLPGAMEQETSRFHLGLEFALSFCLSVLLGANAVLATGVQGPAVTVGNLYYASWLSLLLSLRICLGCLEEIYHVRSPPPEEPVDNDGQPQEKRTLSPTVSLSGSEISLDMDRYRAAAKIERPKRLRLYFFLSIFSLACFASAWDAAYNQLDAVSWKQKYLVLAPAIVAALSVAMFLLCLKPGSYTVASRIFIGGLVSVISFLLWLFDLLIMMHSEDSWAVNGIGEMKHANLYYFCWAAILAAAMQMMSYFKPLFGGQSKDGMFFVWAGIVKVCMVILGAASHVWYNIKDTCAEEGVDAVQRVFCSRTQFAMVVAVVGVLSGWSVMGSRILGCSISSYTRNRAEALLSIVLVLGFGVAVALITSIGGPGQSVGDLYYSTWLAFSVCIGIFVSCYDEMQLDDMETEVARFRNDDEDVGVDYEVLQNN